MKVLDIFANLIGRRNNNHDNFQESLLRSLLIMAWMVEARDPYTGGHLWRVSRFSQLLAEQTGHAANDIVRITIGGFLHDLGKISIPDHILNKKERLTTQEYDIIKTHPDVGWRMLSSHPLAHLAEAAIRCHHETPDGTGYPRGLVLNDIPDDARIVGICDAFDAMTSTRPYRKGMPIRDALAIIEKNQGKQFDLEYSNHFLTLGHAGKLDHIVGHSDEGIPLRDCVHCGPTLVFRRDQKADDLIYCRSCAGEYKVEIRDGRLFANPTGSMGEPQALEPNPDNAIIDPLVQKSSTVLRDPAIKAL